MKAANKNLLSTPARKLTLANQRGVILVGALFIMAFFTILAVAIAEFATNHFVNSKRTYTALSALSVAEAGAEKFMLEINKDKTHTGTNGVCPGASTPITLFDNPTQGKGTFETCIADGAFPNEKIVYSTGKIFTEVSGSTPVSIRKIKLIIRGTNAFEFALQTGTGPLYLYGNTGFTGSIYSNEYIRVQDNSVNINGTFYIVGRLDATNSCSISGNGSVPSSTIVANYKVTSSPCNINAPGSTVTENASPPLVAKQLPTVDKPTIINGITSGATCNSVTTVPYELKNVKYTQSGSPSGSACNVELERNKTYTLKGNVHISGDLLIDGNIINLDPSITTDTYIIVEGRIILKGNGSSVVGNGNSVGIILAAYSGNDAVANCGATDYNCVKNYSSNAIEISGNSLSLHALFLAENGSIGYRGRGSIGSLAAKAIVMNGSGLTTFIQVNVSNVSLDIWNVAYYQQVYDY